MKTRAATPKDAASIAEIWNGVIRDTLWTFTTDLKTEDGISTLIENAQSKRTGVFVSESEDRITGFMTYSQFRNGPGYARSVEHSIVISEAGRGQGVGRALMAIGEDDARSKHHHSMIAGVSSANPCGRAFHEAIGYRYIATLPEVGFKSGTWLGLDLLQKML